ncbi:hypothetical protein [Lewinella sp. W8]|uniref:hypothetical protein n=1 Tax=Lewinella sp. W8 TaxID=2528208 RepID=UPI0010674D63|nr:hypothetical protein [Lewinella sp. W8]MTB53991.1 hypothetical protein [Lewinella sp. W8]
MYPFFIFLLVPNGKVLCAVLKLRKLCRAKLEKNFWNLEIAAGMVLAEGRSSALPLTSCAEHLTVGEKGGAQGRLSLQRLAYMPRRCLTGMEYTHCSTQFDIHLYQ